MWHTTRGRRKKPQMPEWPIIMMAVPGVQGKQGSNGSHLVTSVPLSTPTTRVKRFKLNIICKSHTHTKPAPHPTPPPPTHTQSSTDLERTWSRSCSGRMSATPLATYDLSCSDDMLAVLVAISVTTKKYPINNWWTHEWKITYFTLQHAHHVHSARMNAALAAGLASESQALWRSEPIWCDWGRGVHRFSFHCCWSLLTVTLHLLLIITNSNPSFVADRYKQ